jgi:hypothetical protein
MGVIINQEGAGEREITLCTRILLDIPKDHDFEEQHGGYWCCSMRSTHVD